MGLREDIIAAVKFGSIEEPARAELLELLKMTSFEYRQTNKYSGKDWNKYREYLVARIIPEKMEALRNLKSTLEPICEDVYKENQYYNFMGLEIKPGSIEDMPENASQEVLFDRIENRIIEEIQGARYVIWVAMAWFTNEKIYNELVKKKNAGLSITIVLDKNKTNHDAKFDLFKDFETYEMNVPTKYNNLMHDKFCIIDFNTVLHGTFNWSQRANYNEETFNVDKGKRELVDKFADKFMELKVEAIRQKNEKAWESVF